MSTNALRDGFREVLRDPGLLLFEVVWRWSFGILATVICIVLTVGATKSIPVDIRAGGSLIASDPVQTAQNLASALLSLGVVAVRTGTIAAVLLALCWTVLNAFGRRATLLRPALAPGANLRACFGIASVRALAALGALAAWMLAGLLAGAVLAFGSMSAPPNLWLVVPILLPAFLIIVFAWSIANWYLSLAPLFDAGSWVACLRRAWKLVYQQRDQAIEISIAVGAMRLILLVAAVVVSAAFAALVTNMRMLALDLTAIALLYFFAADFLSVARLGAFAKLRDQQSLAAAQLNPVEMASTAAE
jgi:hypothetical protein